MKIISRNQAKLKGLKRYFTGKPCKHGHISERKTSSHNCIECINVWNANHGEENSKRSSLYYEKNKDACKVKRAAYYQKNNDHFKRKAAEYQENNREKIKVTKAEYRKNNQEKIIEGRKIYNINNRGICNSRGAKYRASKLKACPQWLTDYQLNEMKNIYEECQSKSLETGVKHHVDHIIPLRGEKVSGLHVPWNLQVLTATENFIKNNRVEI